MINSVTQFNPLLLVLTVSTITFNATAVSNNLKESSTKAALTQQKRVLVFAPHPDDDIIGCGGSIAKHIVQGNSVLIVYLTSGDSGSLKYTKQELASIREKEAVQAAGMLGVTRTQFLKYADGYVTNNRTNLVQLITLIRKEQPHIVYIPHAKDAHSDHSKTHEVVADAVSRAAGPWFQECEGNPWKTETVLCYEVWSPLTEVQYAEDITDFMSLKMQALRQHASQMQDIKYDDAVEGLNRYRATMMGKGTFAECFQILKTGSIGS
jgi:N-acetylglucosamine malate deacetylase 1